jgi:hypothetical protein
MLLLKNGVSKEDDVEASSSQAKQGALPQFKVEDELSEVHFTTKATPTRR